VSTEEIIHGLAAADARLDQARQHAKAAAQAAGEAQALVSAALRGSSSGALVAMIGKVRENFTVAAGGIEPAKNAINQTIAQAKALGN
jgi:molybdopterin synthase catalytic subunit